MFQINDSKSNLFTPFNIYLHLKRCELNHCEYLIRTANTLFKYHQYIQQKQTQKQFKWDITNVYESYENNTTLLNDFNHLLMHHHKQFQTITKFLKKHSNPKNLCNLSKCLLLRRNCRNRSVLHRELYFEADHHEIVTQQLIDRIHCYYFHSLHKLPITTHDKHNSRVSELVGVKRQKYSQLPKQYCFGYRFFYWSYCLDSRGPNVDIDPFDNIQQCANDGFSLGHMNIKQKYHTFKEEMTSNKLVCINSVSWSGLFAKADNYSKTIIAKSRVCQRVDSDRYYGIKHNESISIQHIAAILVYCNFDKLQAAFSETFRIPEEKYPNIDYWLSKFVDIKNFRNKFKETVGSWLVLRQVKNKHSHYYWLARLLRECVECFGLKWTSEQHTNINLYRGLSTQLSFSTVNAYIKGPFSCTLDYDVAVNFSAGNGMILDISINTREWQYRALTTQSIPQLFCFDCALWSDYISEQEILFLGGARKFKFNTIIEVTSGVNYQHYCTGLRQMTYNMSNGDSSHFSQLRDKMAKTKDELQMVFRLLSHQIYQHCPDYSLAHKFKNIPKRIDDILHQQCNDIRRIIFDHPGCKAQKMLLQHDNEWIKLDLLVKLFPKLEEIIYHATGRNVLIWKEESVCESILDNMSFSLRKLFIIIDANKAEEIRKYLQKYYLPFKNKQIKIEVAAFPYNESLQAVIFKHNSIQISHPYKSLQWGLNYLFNYLFTFRNTVFVIIHVLILTYFGYDPRDVLTVTFMPFICLFVLFFVVEVVLTDL
eukprot:465192_1